MSDQAPLQMIRAEIGLREFQRWMGMRRLQDPDHAMHCLLVECFGKREAKRGIGPNDQRQHEDGLFRIFRLIVPRGSSRGVLYAYGRADAEELREKLNVCGDPLQCKVIPAETIDSKPMPTEWVAGKKLGFEIRVRPTRRLNSGSKKTRRVQDVEKLGNGEWDAFQLEAIRCPKGTMPRSREEVYRDWLAKRLQRCGAVELDVEETKLVSFQRTRAVRRQHTRHSEGPDALMRGNLVITDGDAFADLLAQGVGRHRAYGYGMLLLRPTH